LVLHHKDKRVFPPRLSVSLKLEQATNILGIFPVPLGLLVRAKDGSSSGLIMREEREDLPLIRIMGRILISSIERAIIAIEPAEEPDDLCPTTNG